MEGIIVLSGQGQGVVKSSGACTEERKLQPRESQSGIMHVWILFALEEGGLFASGGSLSTLTDDSLEHQLFESKGA